MLFLVVDGMMLVFAMLVCYAISVSWRILRKPREVRTPNVNRIWRAECVTRFIERFRIIVRFEQGNDCDSGIAMW